jgi:hypothetical protein
MGEKKGDLKGGVRVVLALLYIFSIPTLFYGLMVRDFILIFSGGLIFALAIYSDIKYDNLLGKLWGEAR